MSCYGLICTRKPKHTYEELKELEKKNCYKKLKCPEGHRMMGLTKLFNAEGKSYL
jgi:hypothetical protein